MLRIVYVQIVPQFNLDCTLASVNHTCDVPPNLHPRTVVRLLKTPFCWRCTDGTELIACIWPNLINSDPQITLVVLSTVTTLLAEAILTLR